MTGAIERGNVIAINNVLSNDTIVTKIVSAVGHKDGWKKFMCKYYEFYNQVPTDEKLDIVFAKIQAGEVES